MNMCGKLGRWVQSPEREVVQKKKSSRLSTFSKRSWTIRRGHWPWGCLSRQCNFPRSCDRRLFRAGARFSRQCAGRPVSPAPCTRCWTTLCPAPGRSPLACRDTVVAATVRSYSLRSVQRRPCRLGDVKRRKFARFSPENDDRTTGKYH